MRASNCSQRIEFCEYVGGYKYKKSACGMKMTSLYLFLFLFLSHKHFVFFVQFLTINRLVSRFYFFYWHYWFAWRPKPCYWTLTVNSNARSNERLHWKLSWNSHKNKTFFRIFSLQIYLYWKSKISFASPYFKL